MSDWYESITGPELEQGDIFLRITALHPTIGDEDAKEGDTVNAIASDASVIVLTQTCDLEQSKVDEVFLAQVITWSNLMAAEVAKGNELIKSRKFREKLIEGNVPNLSLLHETAGPPPLEWSVVNFRRLFSLPVPYMRLNAERVGVRLRMQSPYREHLAQAFARYIMRVGLPHPADEFKAYSPSL